MQLVNHMKNSKTIFAILMGQHLLMLIGPFPLVIVCILFVTVALFFLLRLFQLLFYLKQNPLQQELLVLVLVQIMLDTLEYCLYIHPINYMIYILHYNNYEKVVLLWFLLPFQSDNGALFLGSLIGKNKLCKIVSPSKTIEGVAGALMLPVLTGLLLQYLQNSGLYVFFPGVDPSGFLWLGLAVGAGSVCGDSLESFIKRVGEVKDSGMLFPGHGGMMDRVDSLAINAPLMYLFTRYYIGLDLLEAM